MNSSYDVLPSEDVEDVQTTSSLEASVPCEDFSVEQCHSSLANGSNNTDDTKSTDNSGQTQCDASNLYGLNESSTEYEILYVLAKQSLPVVVSFIVGFAGMFTNMLFAGRIVHENGSQSIVFAGVSLAIMFANVTQYSLVTGFSGAIDTLCSQHNGAGNFKEVGLVLQRGGAILVTITLPVLVLWYYVYDIFVYIGVEPEVCQVMRNYLLVRAISVPGDAVIKSYQRYLSAIGVNVPAMWSNVSLNIFILGFCSLFIFVFKWGYHSLAISWVLSTYLSGLVVFYLSRSEPAVQRTLQPLSWEAFAEWGSFLKLGFPAAVMVCSEWWAYELLTLFASFLGTNQIAAQTILMQITTLVFMIPLGISVICASLVGNSIGSRRVTLAKRIGITAAKFTSLTSAIIGIFIFKYGHYVVAIFTTDESIREHADRAMSVLALSTLVDSLQSVLSSILRGLGQQSVGAYANIAAFYIIGLPVAYIMCFKEHYELTGLIMGIVAGASVQVLFLGGCLYLFQDYMFNSNYANNKTFKELRTEDTDAESELDIEKSELELTEIEGSLEKP